MFASNFARHLTGEHLRDGAQPRGLAILVYLLDHEFESLSGVVPDELGHELVQLLRGYVTAGRPTLQRGRMVNDSISKGKVSRGCT